MLKILIILVTSTWTWAAPVIVNDVTQINPVVVATEIRPTSTEEVQKVVRENPGAISIGGGRFSMGGQIGSDFTTHIDMRGMNQVLAFDPQAKTIRVQAGIRWRDIQKHVDPQNLSVKIMQSYANFTVGGSLSVNVHGRYVGLGPVIMSVRSFTLVLPSGEAKEVSPDNEPELFYGAIGAYGGLGVITEVSLDLVDNVKVERFVKKMPIESYFDFFKREIREDNKAIFHNGDIYPPDYRQVMSITWRETDRPVTVPQRLMPDEQGSWKQRAALLGFSEVPFGKRLRERVVDPLTLRDQPVVYRNFEASYDVSSLEPKSRKETTYVLQEYFVPVAKFDAFVPKMREIFQRHKVNVINVSIRHALKDPGSVLAWAREECFAFVVYYKQGTSAAAKEKVGEWTRELIDAAISVDGTYYLPYQLHATDEQFHRAYPRAKEFFALKKKLDPDYRFRSKIWDRYYYRANYRKSEPLPESQTFLVLPEWYVVFSAQEIADHLKTQNFSSFPFAGSLKQFWSLYWNMNQYIRGKYAWNWEYQTVIAVVGVSTTVEYLIKGIYESTIGRLFEQEPLSTPEDRLAAQVQAEYAAFINHTPWYKFPFDAKLKALRELPEGNWRSSERQFALGMEYWFKKFWAGLINKATSSAYEAPAKEIHMLTKKVPSTHVFDPSVKVATVEDPFYSVLILPRYDEFNRNVVQLAKQNVEFLEVAGNSKIGLTVKASNAAFTKDQKNMEVVHDWPILTQPGRRRYALSVDVQSLSDLLRQFDGNDVTLDHIYDY